MRLSAIAKKIIASRLYDAGITDQSEVSAYLDNVIINRESFFDNNSLFDFIVCNYGKLVIA